MYPELALILVGVAGFTLAVLRLTRSTPHPARENLEGFGYVGAAGLLLLAITVVVVGIFGNHAAQAEGVAMVGFFGYFAYVLVAYVMTRYLSRR